MVNPNNCKKENFEATTTPAPAPEDKEEVNTEMSDMMKLLLFILVICLIGGAIYYFAIRKKSVGQSTDNFTPLSATPNNMMMPPPKYGASSPSGASMNKYFL
jgi:hypothetical protein